MPGGTAAKWLRGEEKRLLGAFGRALVVCAAVPLGVIACSHTDSSAKPETSSGTDACVPTLDGVFFGVVDGGSECRATQHLACGLPSTVHVLDGGCSIRASDCKAICPSYGAFNCQLVDASCSGGRVSKDGPVSVSCDFCPGGIGRRPAECALPEARHGRNALAAYFEQVAFLEGASVRAFTELADDLTAARAPVALLAAARRAASDEVRHRAMTARLARRFGGRAPPCPRARAGAARPTPSLEDMAVANAVEGCVRETYGALVASHQALHAEDAGVAAAMEKIARDETRHAALSWTLFRWTIERLGDVGRAMLDSAIDRALAELCEEAQEPDEDLRSIAGLPSAIEQRRLLFHLGSLVRARRPALHDFSIRQG